MLFAADYAVAGRLAWTPGGFALSFGRMLQDGIVKRYLDEHCPDPALATLRLQGPAARRRRRLVLGQRRCSTSSAASKASAPRWRRIALGSLLDYPGLQLKAAVRDTARQLIDVRTGEGVLNSIWHTYGIIERFTPQLVPAMRAARQQKGDISLHGAQPPALSGGAVVDGCCCSLIVLLALRGRLPADIGEFGAVARSRCSATLSSAARCPTRMTATARAWSGWRPWRSWWPRPAWHKTGLGGRARWPRLSARTDAAPCISYWRRAMADAAVMQQLAPTGKLRVAIAVAPAPSAQFAIKDGDGYKGVAVALGKALADKLGVPAALIAHQASGEIQNSAADNKWDVAFLPVDEERKKFVDFGNAYHLLQSTFLVAAASQINAVKDANAQGDRHRRRRQYRDLPRRQAGDAQGHAYRLCRRRCRGRRHERRPHRSDRAVARIARRARQQDSRLAHSCRRVPQFLDRSLRAQGQAGRARISSANSSRRRRPPVWCAGHSTTWA